MPRRPVSCPGYKADGQQRQGHMGVSPNVRVKLCSAPVGELCLCVTLGEGRMSRWLDEIYLNFISTLKLADSKLRTCRNTEGRIGSSSFSASHYRRLGPDDSLWSALSCVLKTLSSIPHLHPLEDKGAAPQSDCQKCPQTLPDVSWGTKSSLPSDSHHSKGKIPSGKIERGLEQETKEGSIMTFSNPHKYRCPK